ncbi:hypothetical protein BH10PSE10_BH10PSE10_03880 [soil metagenome]
MNRAALSFAILLIGCATAHAQYGVPNRSGTRVEGGFQGNYNGSRFNDQTFQRNYNQYNPDGNTTVLVPRGGPSPSRGNSIYIQNPPAR